jgi:dihydroneopterin aldolase
MFPELANLVNGQNGGGAMSVSGFDQLQKALTAGYGTDVSQLTGGGALRIQSLDKQMKSTIAENKHFRLMNRLAKSDATATVDEWTEHTSVGGFLGGSTNTEDGVISDATGDYKRQTATVKYLMTRRQVSLVSTLGNNIVSAAADDWRAPSTLHPAQRQRLHQRRSLYGGRQRPAH